MHRFAALLLLATVLLPAPLPPLPAALAATYAIDQRFGQIAFTVRHLGLFASRGTFRRFAGTLTIDGAHPENTRIAVAVDTGSVAMAWQAAAEMLRTPAYFDVRRYPEARFVSTRVIALAPDRYRIEGALTLRGVTHPVSLHAELVGRQAGPEPGSETATFVVTGTLRRSSFGMTADPLFVSDLVDLRIDARVRLEGAEQ